MSDGSVIIGSDPSWAVQKVLQDANGNLMALNGVKAVAASWTGDNQKAFYNALSAAIAPIQAQSDANNAYAQSQVNEIFGGFITVTAGGALAVATAPAWLPAIGYSGSLSTMGGSFVLKSAIGLGVQYTADAMTGNTMNVGEAIGTIVTSAVAAPGANSFLINKGIDESAAFILANGSGSLAGNIVQQGTNLLDGAQANFKWLDFGLSGATGTLAGAIGTVGLKAIPGFQFISTAGNSLLKDISELPGNIGGIPSAVTQYKLTEPAPHP